jgi:hypothetical protein
LIPEKGNNKIKMSGNSFLEIFGAKLYPVKSFENSQDESCEILIRVHQNIKIP